MIAQDIWNALQHQYAYLYCSKGAHISCNGLVQYVVSYFRGQVLIFQTKSMLLKTKNKNYSSLIFSKLNELHKCIITPLSGKYGGNTYKCEKWMEISNLQKKQTKKSLLVCKQAFTPPCGAALAVPYSVCSGRRTEVIRLRRMKTLFWEWNHNFFQHDLFSQENPT